MNSKGGRSKKKRIFYDNHPPNYQNMKHGSLQGVEKEVKIAQNYYINQININNLKNNLKKQLNGSSVLKKSSVSS
jgi:hypothetical protein